MTIDQGACDDPSQRESRTTGSPNVAPAAIASRGLVGTSAATRRLHDEITRFARTSATVLVRGESGVGKEKIAAALHTASPRAERPFVIVDCASLPEHLLEAELFGHAKGAFTGATNARAGAFEMADGGTVFLDEIGEMPIAMQPKLLRVLESHTVRRVGESNHRRVNMRVVAATNRDLVEMIRERTFREDLYFRLAVLMVSISPLRERRDDLPSLVEHLLRRLRPEIGTRRLTPGALDALTAYDWPGNVRQLLNVLRRTAARTDASTLDADAIRAALAVEPGAVSTVPYRVAVPREIPPSMVAETVGRWGGNISRAARELGLARSTVRDRLLAHRAPTGAAPSTHP